MGSTLFLPPWLELCLDLIQGSLDWAVGAAAKGRQACPVVPAWRVASLWDASLLTLCHPPLGARMCPEERDGATEGEAVVWGAPGPGGCLSRVNPGHSPKALSSGVSETDIFVAQVPFTSKLHIQRACCHWACASCRIKLYHTFKVQVWHTEIEWMRNLCLSLWDSLVAQW